MTLGLKYELDTLNFGKTRHQFLTHTLSARISSWRAHSGNASVPDAHAQGTHQFLTRTLRARISSWRACCSACFEGPFQIWNFYAYAEHTHKKLIILIIRSPDSSEVKKNYVSIWKYLFPSMEWVSSPLSVCYNKFNLNIWQLSHILFELRLGPHFLFKLPQIFRSQRSKETFLKPAFRHLPIRLYIL